MTNLKPTVYWAQNENNVFLKIRLNGVKQPELKLDKRKLQFQSTKGSGTQGFKDCEFFIDFYSEVDESKNCVKITDHEVNLTLSKFQKEWWPRLTFQPQKPMWLKLDLDCSQSKEDIIQGNYGDLPDLYDKSQKEEIGYRKEDLKKMYLTIYTFSMFSGFLYVFLTICIKYLRNGSDCYPHLFKSVDSVMCFIQVLQYLEVLHTRLGYVKGQPLMPFLQVSGRCIILILMLECEPRLQKMSLIFPLFLSWCGIEIIRYPYYMFRLYKIENGLLTWIRYSAWIFLYPFGFFIEVILISRNAIFIDESNKWSVTLPNSLNVTFHFATVLRLYIIFVMCPSMYLLLSYLYKARKQKLGTGNIRRVKES